MGELMLLNGGHTKSINKLTLDDFSKHISNYVLSIRQALDSYYDLRNKIADEIKSIGASGIINGAVIKIFEYGQIFINPLNSEIKIYVDGPNANEGIEFANLPSLMAFLHERMIIKYNKIIAHFGDTSNNIVLRGDFVLSKKTTSFDTSKISKINKVVTALYYTSRYNLVRIWNKDVIPNGTKENGKQIIQDLIDTK
ncbi:hypothetical protein CJJ23_04660 [Mycoplasmopsis agassizii]|uniref:Uncharacterized protein n=1 Tax=Mycoplasmopsis agassizii TaxID=33922 RepID=A0A269THH4_9BACT|nr:hypothetical protein [Mycoplasmopsis agassizii]PAK20919.1 hypothetical protein CJJ23_04660 [Mycoplasmopsis agassizii]